MNSHYREGDSVIIEQTKSLLKYDLLSCVKSYENLRPRPRVEGANMQHYFGHLGFITLPSARREIEVQRERFRCIIDCYLQDFMWLHFDRHLISSKNPSLAITNYLSLLEKLVDFRINKQTVFIRCLDFLFEARVNDRDVWKKLFLYVKYTYVTNVALVRIHPERLGYFLRHICCRYVNNKEILKTFLVAPVIHKGRHDQLKVYLEYNNCIEYSENDVICYLEDLFSITLPLSKVTDEILHGKYSVQRIFLVLQMARMVPIISNFTKWTPLIKRTLKGPYLEALKLSWKVIPQAYITSEEMEDVLRKLSNCPADVNYEHPYDFLISRERIIPDKISEYCEKYRRMFDVPVLQPRSLKNYARIAARKIYSTSFIIDELMYPKILKTYLKLD